MNHKAKVKLARRLRTNNERYAGLFQSKAWLERKWRIRMRVLKRQTIAHYYAQQRKQRKMAENLPQVTIS